jgi:hypothetical protein
LSLEFDPPSLSDFGADDDQAEAII